MTRKEMLDKIDADLQETLKNIRETTAILNEIDRKLDAQKQKQRDDFFRRLNE